MLFSLGSAAGEEGTHRRRPPQAPRRWGQLPGCSPRLALSAIWGDTFFFNPSYCSDQVLGPFNSSCQHPSDIAFALDASYMGDLDRLRLNCLHWDPFTLERTNGSSNRLMLWSLDVHMMCQRKNRRCIFTDRRCAKKIKNVFPSIFYLR
jgi:hypothetical protein